MTSSRKGQTKRNAINDGIVVISAIMLPLRKISFFASLAGFSSSDNKLPILKNGEQNQRYL